VSTEVCDGLDNDCDEATDEELGTIGCGAGECRRTVDACVGGLPQQCVPGQAVLEVCGNGLDDDCDGRTDDEEDCALFVRVLDLPSDRARATTRDRQDWGCLQQEYTVEAWVKIPFWTPAYTFQVASVGSKVMFTVEPTPVGWGFRVFCGSYHAGQDQYSGPYFDTGGGDWRHLACVDTGAAAEEQVVLFVDGVPRRHGWIDRQVFLPLPTTLRIGADSSRGLVPGYQLEELRLSSLARYQGQGRFEVPRQPLADDEQTCELWHFDEPDQSTKMHGVRRTVLHGESGARVRHVAVAGPGQ